MDPIYFAHTLTFYEAELFCRGLRRRERGAWERARYVAYHAAAPHCKGLSPDKMRRFPWEREEVKEKQSEEEALREIEVLREYARLQDEMFDKTIK